jgi:hypothetical protein
MRIGWLRRVTAHAGALIRRRGLITSLVAALVFALSVAGLGLLPVTCTAQSFVAPIDDAAYVSPLSQRLIDRTLTPTYLNEVSQAGGYGVQDSILTPEEGEGIKIEPVHGPRNEVVHFRVQASGLGEEAALAATRILAGHLAALNEELRQGVIATNRELPQTRDEPADEQPDYRAQLAELQQDYPELFEPALSQRVNQLDTQLLEDEVAVRVLETQVLSYTDEATRMRTQVQLEAAQAYAASREEADRADSAREAALRGEQDRRLDRARASNGRLADLEAELRDLESRYQDRHPRVRRVRAAVESERQRILSDSPAPASRDSDLQDARSDDGTELSLPIAGPDTTPEEVPDHWVLRAPSYHLWTQARSQRERARIELELRRNELIVRQGARDTLMTRQERQREARVQESRLLRQIESQDLAARQRLAEAPQAPSPVPPSLTIEPPVILQRVSPLDENLPWALLLSIVVGLLTGGLLELRDRSVHQPSDLSRFPVPTLGVVPHLRRGR